MDVMIFPSIKAQDWQREYDKVSAYFFNDLEEEEKQNNDLKLQQKAALNKKLANREITLAENLKTLATHQSLTSPSKQSTMSTNRSVMKGDMDEILDNMEKVMDNCKQV